MDVSNLGQKEAQIPNIFNRNKPETNLIVLEYLKDEIVTFYMLNNNFFYSQVVFGNIFFFH